MKLLKKCPTCKKIVEETKTIKSDGIILLEYSCGHFDVKEESIAKDSKSRDEYWKSTFSNICWNCKTEQDYYKLSPICWNCKTNGEFNLPFYSSLSTRSIPTHHFKDFQKECIEFVERSNFRCLIADEMGLGKTIEVLGTIRYNKEKLLPVLFIVKSGLRYNWVIEIIKWLTDDPKKPALPYIISDGIGAILPGFDYYIVSMGILNKVYQQILDEIHPQLIVIDESHHFKSSVAKKTSALTKLVPHVPHLICTSGSPIMNRGKEYFTTLNLLKPEHWPYESIFERQWLEPTYHPERGTQNGYGGIRKNRISDFKERTSEYIIRRLKTDVMKDLPSLTRNFKIIDISDCDARFRNAYNQESKLLEAYLYSADFKKDSQLVKYSNILARVTKMRELAGVMKAPFVAEEVIDFLESTEEENEKICVGISFPTIVGFVTKTALADYNPIFLTGLDSSEQKKQKEDNFRSSGYRLMISSILAGGEGLNFQFCSRAIIMELEWNVMRERQYEGRFHRFGQKNPVSVDYYIAKGTIDEYMTDLRRKKKQWTDTAIQIDASDEKEVSVGWMELAEAVAGKTI